MAGRPAAAYGLDASCVATRELMADNILRMPASRGTALDRKTARAYTESLVQTIWHLDKQIERVEELLGADRAHHFLRAIEAHVVDKLGRRSQLRGNHS